MAEESRKLRVSTHKCNEASISESVNKTLQVFGANVNKLLLAKKRRVSQLTEGAAEIYHKKLEDVYILEAEKWSECQQSLQQQCEPVLDDLKEKFPSVEKSGLILLKTVLQQKALLEEVSKHQAEKIEQLKNMIGQFKQRSEVNIDYQAKLQKNLPDYFRAELLNLNQEIVQKTQKDDVEKIKTIMKNIYEYS